MDVLLLAPVNPFEIRDGHTMAVASDMRAVLDNGLSVGVISFLYGNQQRPAPYRRSSAMRGAILPGARRDLFLLDLCAAYLPRSLPHQRGCIRLSLSQVCVRH